MSAQSVTLLRRGQMIFCFKRVAQSSGVPLRRVLASLTMVANLLLGLYHEEIRLLFHNPLSERKSGSQTLHRILPSYASSSTDLIVNVNT